MVDDQSDQVLQELLKNRMDPILYDTYQVTIHHSVARKLGSRAIEDPGAVEDCVQETFKNAYRNLLKSKSDDELSNLALDSGIIKWLHEIAENVVNQFWKRSRRKILSKQKQPEENEEIVLFVLVPLSQPGNDLEHDILDEHAGNPEDILVEKENIAERHEITKSAVEALPEKYRKPLSLRFLTSGKLYPETKIAKELNVSVGTVKSWLSRGLDMAQSYVAAAQKLKEIDKNEFEKSSDLDSRYRKVLLLHFYEHLEWSHIAQKCGFSEDKAKKILHRGIKLLFPLLEGEKKQKYE